MEDVTAALQNLKVGQRPVYLLKTKSSPSDQYEEHFENLDNGTFKPIFVPVLEHYLREDTLRKLRLAAERFAFAGGSEADGRRKATNNPAKKYGGIVFTSQRAVDAFATVVMKLNPAKVKSLFDSNMPLYVVGAATARGAEALGLPCPIVGAQTGTGEALAAFVKDWHQTLPRDVTHLDGRKLPLLFLTGEQRRDVIPTTLQSDDLPPEEQIQVVEIVVYETGEAATFEEEFTVLVREAKKARITEQWVVVFSPQGCEAMLNSLGWLDEKGGKFSAGLKEIVSGPSKTLIATIGPTTRDYLLQQFGFVADVCAPQPSPEGLGRAILDSSTSHS